MVEVTFGGIEVNRCTDCEGLFFDEFEKEQLWRMKGADVLDIGNVKTGREFDKVDHINCPRCTSLTIRIKDLEQPHIWFWNNAKQGSTIGTSNDLQSSRIVWHAQTVCRQGMASIHQEPESC